MKNKVVNVEDAVSLVKSGMTIMSGGFKAGAPAKLLDALSKTNVENLTVISNDGGVGDTLVGALVREKKVKKLIASHIGLNKETQRQMIASEMEVELVPQGTFIERIRCGGSGIGGFYTETGVGTLIEENKETKVIDGKKYLLELPLHADIAFVSASVADEFGNLYFRGTTRNFNPCMAMAADIVVAEVSEIVKTGDLSPDIIVTPGILVDYVVKGGEQ
jgi:acetate CoA/acetoacetate CoA-transferase alpha subunit